MKRDPCRRVEELFTAHSVEVTPAPARPAARVLFVRVSPDPEVASLCRSVLSEDELERADRFRFARDKALFEQRRAFRRFCGARALRSSRSLSQFVFEETEHGRPYLPETGDLWFSFSSCRSGILGAWSSTHGIGVDIEDPARPLEAADLASSFFSSAEAEAVERAHGERRLSTFYRLWSFKEAALKSIGQGLPYGLDAFELELDPQPRVVRAPSDCGDPARFDVCAIEGTGLCAALVLRRRA